MLDQPQDPDNRLGSAGGEGSQGGQENVLESRGANLQARRLRERVPTQAAGEALGPAQGGFGKGPRTGGSGQPRTLSCSPG